MIRCCGVGLILLTLLAGCGERPSSGVSSSEHAIRDVEVRLVSARALTLTHEAVGTVEPRLRVSPAGKVLGRAETVPVRVGDRVEQGQLLLRLERSDLEAAVARATADVATADAERERAERQERRIAALHARGSATDRELDDARAAMLVSVAGLEQARAVRVAAEVTLGYATVRSPLAGRVVQRHIEAGDMVVPGVALMTIEDVSRVEVVARVSESVVVELAEGDPVTVRVDTLERTWEARIDRVVSAGDPFSRSYDLRVRLDNPDGTLRSGMFARVKIERGVREALVVPRTAIVERGQLRGLFVVVDGEARLRWVRTASEAGDEVEVVAGLSQGEAYVVAPASELVDGAAVREVRR